MTQKMAMRQDEPVIVKPMPGRPNTQNPPRRGREHSVCTWQQDSGVECVWIKFYFCVRSDALERLLSLLEGRGCHRVVTRHCCLQVWARMALLALPLWVVENVPLPYQQSHLGDLSLPHSVEETLLEVNLVSTDVLLCTTVHQVCI